MATPGSPLLGSWPSTAGVNVPGAPTTSGTPAAATTTQNSTPALPAAPAGTSGTTNPYGFGSLGGGSLAANLAESNLQSNTYKNSLLPLFAQQMFSSGVPAAQFFQNLMNLGSPYYQQKQAQSFGQGVQAAQSSAAQARQQLNASGAGYSPSGAGAAMFGGMGQAEAGNQSEQFLNNLFQNEQLQTAGATGAAQMASLFNPAQLTGQQANTSIAQAQNTLAQMLQAFGSLFSGAGAGATSGAGIDLMV